MSTFLRPDQPAPTLQDIADVCDVTKTTVSLALRNHPCISEATRVKIVAAVDKVTTMLQRNNIGVPTKPRMTLVEGQWVTGRTLKALAKTANLNHILQRNSNRA